MVFDDSAQLLPRFPLLADSGVFLATLIDIFKAYGVSSLFVSVTGAGSDTSLDHKLTVLADNALEMKRDDSSQVTVSVVKLAGHFIATHRAPASLGTDDRIVLTSS